MSTTKIEWADRVWNPVTGCTKVSAGCKNCYAERMAHRFTRVGELARKRLDHQYDTNDFNDVLLHPDRLDQPLRWRKPSRVFVNSMSDLFHPDVPDEFIDQVFGTVARCPQHIFMVLTKRPAEMKDYWGWSNKSINRRGNIQNILDLGPGRVKPRRALSWPLPNLWLGVSVEDQATADERIPLLLQTPAAVRFVSCEPLLGPVNFRWTPYHHQATGQTYREYLHSHGEINHLESLRMLDWVIAGGESGPGARPMHPDWVRGLRDQCQDAGVPFFFKQWGEYVPVPILRDDRFAGGLVIDDPGRHGGRSSILIRTGTPRPFTSRPMRELRVGEETRGGRYRLDETTMAVKVGKKAAGNTLDGRTHLEFPGGAE